MRTQRKFLIILLVIAFAALPSFATIPLQLQQVIQLPHGGSWDLQHVLDDSTFGWAHLNGDTVRYQLSDADSVHTFIVPVGLFGANIMSHSTNSVRLLRMNIAGGHLCAMVYGISDAGDQWEIAHTNVLCFIDLETMSCIDTVFSEGGYFDSNYSSSHLTFRQFLPWPPLPDTSVCMLYSGVYTSSQYTMGDEAVGSADGVASRLDFADSMHVIRLGSWDNLQFYTGSDTSLVAMSDHSTTWHDYGGNRQVTSDLTWLGTYSHGTVVRVSLNGGLSMAAQADANGTCRMIAGQRGIDPASLATLWNNPTLYGWLYTAHVAGSHDERLLALGTGIFTVYNASDGSLMDWTSTFQGTFQTILKRNNRPSEIITYDATTSRVFVYETPLPPMRGVTFTYLPETGMMRLRWPRAEQANGYRIWECVRLPGPYYPIATVPADSTRYDFLSPAFTRFYYVTEISDTP